MARVVGIGWLGRPAAWHVAVLVWPAVGRQRGVLRYWFGRLLAGSVACCGTGLAGNVPRCATGLVGYRPAAWRVAVLVWLFPFDGAGGFGGDVVDDAVDAGDFVDDAAADAGEEVVGEAGPVGGHEVFGGDGAEGDDFLVGTAVAHDADAFDGEEDGEGLLGAFAEHAGGAQLVDEDGVGLAQGLQAIPGEGAEAADGEAGAGEGLAPDDFVGQAEGGAEAAHFVFEEEAQGLDELEVHVVGQAADVVVGLDEVGVFFVFAGAFDDVGVDGALGEEVDVAEAARFAFEDADEFFADDAPFLFGIGDAVEGFEVFFDGVDGDEAHAHFAIEGFDDLEGFALAEEAVIDEDAGELARRWRGGGGRRRRRNRRRR